MKAWGLILLLSSLCGCNLAPRTERPTMPIPKHYKEVGDWVKMKPTLALAEKGQPWWTVLGDSALNQLEESLTAGNPSLAVVYARFEEARALAQEARSFLYPTVLALAGQTRQFNSKEVSNVYSETTFLFNTATLQAFLSYEVDVWGQIRNTVSAATHGARASQYDLASMDLSLHAALAADYIELRGVMRIQHELDALVQAYAHALRLVKNLHRGGAVSALDEDQARNQWGNAKTAATNIRLKRAKLEHAIAVLVGAIPANFQLPKLHSRVHYLGLRPDIPSRLLQQRPDIAAMAERVEAANATIGVARAAFFPVFNLTGILGVQNKRMGSLFSNPSLIWALGPPGGLMSLATPEISQIAFDGYYLQANLKHAKAAYYEAVNGYRQTVLTAFQEVEDSLVAMHRLGQERNSQAAATRAAWAALYQVNQRMQDGMDTYLGVIAVENEARQARISLINIEVAYQLATVHLIKALGGGWSIDQALKQSI